MNDLAVGIKAGLIQTLFYPLELLKTHSQLKHPFIIHKEVRRIHSLYGVRGFYHGCRTPFFVSMINNEILFNVYQYYKCALGSFWSGFVAGATTSVFLQPFEIIKVNRQFQTPLSWNRMWTQGLYRAGWRWTFLRESMGCGIYFGSFDYLHHHLSTPIAGGIAGVLSWMLIYPIDVIKTRSQIIGIAYIHQPPSVIGMVLTIIRSFVVNSLIFVTCYQ